MKFIFISLFFSMISFFTNNKQAGLDKHYTLIKKIDNVEIREYQDLIYASYIPENERDRNNSFRNVASYIFGGNNKDEEIAMTSPVVIKLHHKNEMAFIMPKKYSLNNLPQPNNKAVKIYKEKSSIKACIRYSGYSNSKTEKQKIELLKNTLEKHDISHNNDFEVLVYNSPWKILNRRNEIAVSIDYEQKKEVYNTNFNKFYVGGGCFWCVEAVFEDVIGVKHVRSGYSGGEKKNPTYQEVSQGRTDHAEVCEITYDSQHILLEDLLKIFFLSHDPTTLNRQGNDIGKHYRSIIFYTSEKERVRVVNFKNKINKEIFDNKIVTEVKPFKYFYEAEKYHQDYYKRNISESYCKIVITPKVIKAKKELSKYYQ